MKTKVFVFIVLVNFLLCTAVLVSWRSATAQGADPSTPGPLVLTDAQGEYQLGLHLEVLEDPSGELMIEDVSSPAYESRFIPSRVKTPNFGYTDSAYWVRVRINNQTSRTADWLLEVGFPNTHYVDLYSPLPGGEGFSVKQTGALRPPETRDIRHPGFVFSLVLPTQSEQMIYLRFKSGASMNIPLILWNQTSFINRSLSQAIFQGLYYGVLIGLLFYNIFLLFSFKEANYLYLVLFLTGFLLWNASYDGYIGTYFLTHIYSIKPYFDPLTFATWVISLVLFGTAVLEFNTNLPIYRRIALLLLAVWGILVVLIPFTSLKTISQLMVTWALPSCITLLAAGIVLWKRGYAAVRYFIIAWFGLLASIIVAVVVRLGIIPSSFIADNSFRVGLVWMSIGWSITLADRVNLLKIKTEKANQELRNSEGRLSQILDGMPLGVVLYTQDLKPKYANRRTIDLLSDPARGIKPDITAGRTLMQAIQYFSLKVAGSQRDYPMENYPVFSALRGTPALADDIEMDRGDERVPLEVWASPIRDETGQVESAVVVIQDITQRKQAEAELAEYHKHLEALVDERTAEVNATNKELRLRLSWLAAVNLVNQMVARSVDFRQVYEKILEIINQLFTTKGAFIAELDRRGTQLKILAHSCYCDPLPGLVNSLTMLPKEILSHPNLEQGKLVFISGDQLQGMSGPAGGTFGQHIESSELQSIVLVPLQLHEQVLGFLGLELEEAGRIITNEEHNLLSIFSTDIAQLIEDTHLFEQTRAMIAAEERNRLARDLHDSVTQTLFSATLLADVVPQIWKRDPSLGLQELNKLKRLTRGALVEMRTMLLELRPAAVTKTPLSELLSQLTEAIASRSGLAVHLFIEQVPILPEEVQLNFYRIAQEALNNVVKHAQAGGVSVKLSSTLLPADEPGKMPQKVWLQIEDDGVGFAMEQSGSEHLGIGIMHERAAAIQADLSLASQPGHGTQLVLTWFGETGTLDE